MFEKLSDEEVDQHLFALIEKMGAKEKIPDTAFRAYLKKKDKKGCILEIAKLLDLPVRINLSVASEDYRQENAKRFTSSAMVHTDEEHRGKESIIAQVTVPKYLPAWGTSDLEGYPIEVLVSENCLAKPDTFITIMAHELSHILLAAVRSPYKESEFHTDLVPILFGFGEFVRRGRQMVYATVDGSTTTRHTVTYGYLSDEIFKRAYDYVKGFLDKAQKKKKVLSKLIRHTEKTLNETINHQAVFREYYIKMDSSRPKEMKREHAQRLVQLHGQDADGEWQVYLSGVQKRFEQISASIRDLQRYTPKAADDMDAGIRVLENISDELDKRGRTMINDSKIMRKYVDK